MVVSRLVLSGMIATGSGAIILMEAIASLRGNAKFSRLRPLNSPCADRRNPWPASTDPPAFMLRTSFWMDASCWTHELDIRPLAEQF